MNNIGSYFDDFDRKALPCVFGGLLLLMLVAFACSDQDTYVTPSIQEHHDHHFNHGKHCTWEEHRFWVAAKDCQSVIDSLEAELEECRDD